MATEDKGSMSPIEITYDWGDEPRTGRGLLAVLLLLFGLILGLTGAATVNISTKKTETAETVRVVEVPIDSGSTIEFSTEDKPVEVDEKIAPMLEGVDVKTVEEVDGGQLQTGDAEAVDEVLEDAATARGAYYRTDTLQHFIEDTQNKCVVEGNIFGAQCVSLFIAFQSNYTGRGLSTCGTGAAYGLWDCRGYNAGAEYELIFDPLQLLPGDIAVFSGGTWGHVGFIVGAPNNGYIALYGENQGGALCPAGGAQPNVINISLRNFLGAFRPKIYAPAVPESTPESPNTGVAK